MFSHPILISLVVFLVLIIIWIVGGFLVIQNIEQPQYEVIEEHNGYEVRKYEPYLVAQTTVRAETQREALITGFRIVADYIFGNNTTQIEVAMTAPVVSAESSEKIAMTSPVVSAENTEGEWTVAFIMPSQYTKETIPQPNSPKVILREVPTRTVAVLPFGWYATDSRIAQKKEKLEELLTQDGEGTIGKPHYAGYNPPLTAPFMQRHEILMELSQ